MVAENINQAGCQDHASIFSSSCGRRSSGSALSEKRSITAGAWFWNFGGGAGREDLLTHWIDVANWAMRAIRPSSPPDVGGK